jgi:hypothetical protein
MSQVLTRVLVWSSLLLASVCVAAEQNEPNQTKTLSGMSVLGNDEAPKSLVIVPWKASEIGSPIGVDNLMDDRARPVDKEVFQRELNYYQIRSNTGRWSSGR